MAANTSNLTNIVTSNTFNDWRTQTNLAANDVNIIVRGEFVKPEGNVVMSTGKLTLANATGTTLEVTADARIANKLSVKNIEQDVVSYLYSQSGDVQFSNATGTVIVQGNTRTRYFYNNIISYTANTVANGYHEFTGLNSNNGLILNVANYLTVANGTGGSRGNVNVSTNLTISSNTTSGNLVVLGLANVATGNIVTANIATLNVNATGATATIANATVANSSTTNAIVSLLTVTTRENVVLANIITANIATLNVNATGAGANIAVATIATGNITTLNVNTAGATAAINVANIITGNVTTLNVTNETVTTLNVTNETVTTLNVTNETVTTLNVTNETVTTLNVTNETVTTLNVTSETVTTLNVTNETVSGTINAAIANIGTLAIATANIATLNVSGSAAITVANIATGNVVTLNVTSETVGTLNVSNQTVSGLLNVASANISGSAKIYNLTVDALTVNSPIVGSSEISSGTYRLRAGVSTRGSGNIGVFQGSTSDAGNSNAWIAFDGTGANVWRVTANSSTPVTNGWYTLITTQNVSDSIVTIDSANVGSLTAVKTSADIAKQAYAQANIALSTVDVYQTNTATTFGSVKLNFANTASINVYVTSGAGAFTGNANITFTANTSNPAALGPQGFQGIQGAQGFQGNNGGAGVQGAQGVQGSQGNNGGAGVQGSQGNQGNNGGAGVQGSQGNQGNNGTNGAQGSQGLTGPSTAINSTNSTAGNYFLVGVAAAGSNQTPSSNGDVYINGSKLYTKSLQVSPGTNGVTSGLYINGGDVTAARSSSTGTVYLGSDGAHYLYYNGINYDLAAGSLVLSAGYEVQASRFTDVDNTAYYIDPAGQSVINSLKTTRHIMYLSTDTSVGTTKSLDLATSAFFKLTFNTGSGASPTITLTNPPTSTSNAYMFSIAITQSTSGGSDPQFSGAGATFKWPGNSKPPATTDANATDIWSFITFDGGTTYYGTLSMKNV